MKKLYNKQVFILLSYQLQVDNCNCCKLISNHKAYEFSIHILFFNFYWISDSQFINPVPEKPLITQQCDQLISATMQF